MERGMNWGIPQNNVFLDFHMGGMISNRVRKFSL
jgi:hypothetical protein